MKRACWRPSRSGRLKELRNPARGSIPGIDLAQVVNEWVKFGILSGGYLLCEPLQSTIPSHIQCGDLHVG